MDVKEIITCDKYKAMCKKIAGGDELWRDLHQEFVLRILEKEDKASILENPDVFCYVIIRTIWYGRKLNSNYITRDKSSLYRIADNYGDFKDYIEHSNLNKVTANEKEIKQELNNQLNKLLNSDNERTKQQGKLLKMFCEGTNRLKISKELGINYKIVHEQIEEAKNKIKFNMTGIQTITKNDITVKLRAEEAKPSYSGKDKTFYVEKVSEETKQMILKAGFKVEKK